MQNIRQLSHTKTPPIHTHKKTLNIQCNSLATENENSFVIFIVNSDYFWFPCFRHEINSERSVFLTEIHLKYRSMFCLRGRCLSFHLSFFSPIFPNFTHFRLSNGYVCVCVLCMQRKSLIYSYLFEELWKTKFPTLPGFFFNLSLKL